MRTTKNIKGSTDVLVSVEIGENVKEFGSNVYDLYIGETRWLVDLYSVSDELKNAIEIERSRIRSENS